MSNDSRILFVSHNHPDLFPGGAEIFAHELFRAMSGTPGWDAFFLARCGPEAATPKIGTPFLPVADDPRQALAFTNQYDPFYHVQPDKEFALVHFRELLTSYRPDVVHYQHTVNLGLDLLEVTRRTLPEAAIVYTLHEYLPICHSHGQMVTPKGFELCERASPQRCHRCFPDRTPQQFFLREQLAKHYLRHVDAFLCPSHFLASRYEQWGIEPSRLHYLENGRRPQRAAPPRMLRAGERRDRFAFFGQINPYKGLLVLLRAAALVEELHHLDVHVAIHGANLEMQKKEFQDEFQTLLADVEETVTFHGPYAPSAMASLMEQVDWVVIPSIWWENAPLVIQEAFMHGRPVICSDIGGMAERVEDDVNGLHFEVGRPESLAEVIMRASSEPGLWDRLHAGIPHVATTDEAVGAHLSLYRELLANRRTRPVETEVSA